MTGSHAVKIGPVGTTHETNVSKYSKNTISILRNKRLPALIRYYVAAQCISFFLYTTFGKGYAYVGYAPLYVGELLLCFGVFAAATSLRLWAICTTPIGMSLAIFLVWEIFETVPYLARYGVDTLRDAAVWDYSLFGLAIAALVLRIPKPVDYVLIRYRAYVRYYVIFGLAAAILSTYFMEYLPVVPSTSVTIPALKNGDFCVALAGVFTFIASGVLELPTWCVPMIAIGLTLGGSINRGGLLAFIVASVVIALLRRQFKVLFVFLLSFLCLFSVFILFQGLLGHDGSHREFSPSQIISNISSISGDTDDPKLEGTKKWRLDWWSQIIDYTVYGPYFWTGKGYGINLAVDDGVNSGTKSGEEVTLRSPHNSHLTFLARSGVPGFCLWVGLQLCWLITMLQRHRRAEKVRDRRSTALFAWLISYWAAFLVNASFDVSLEGPVAAIPFWTIFGLGWGFSVLFDNNQHGKQFLRAKNPVAKLPFHSS